MPLVQVEVEHDDDLSRRATCSGGADLDFAARRARRRQRSLRRNRRRRSRPTPPTTPPWPPARHRGASAAEAQAADQEPSPPDFAAILLLLDHTTDGNVAFLEERPALGSGRSLMYFTGRGAFGLVFDLGGLAARRREPRRRRRRAPARRNGGQLRKGHSEPTWLSLCYLATPGCVRKGASPVAVNAPCRACRQQ